MKHHSQPSGFTLIEILASMAVLVLMVLFLANLFDQVTKSWKKGEKQIYIFDSARGVMDEINRDCQAAIADSILPFAAQNIAPAGYMGNQDRLYFTSAVVPRSTSATKTDIDEVVYFIKINNGRGTLYRRFESASAKWYYTTGTRQTYNQLFFRTFFNTPDGNTDELIDNVHSFEVLPSYDPSTGFYQNNFFSKDTGNTFPTNGVTFYLRVLTDEQWEMTNVLNTSEWLSYVTNNGSIFSLTVTFPTGGR